MATGEVFRVVREYRPRIHWPPLCWYLDVRVSIGRLARWLRLFLFCTREEQYLCSGMGLSRKEYRMAFKDEGIRRYR